MENEVYKPSTTGKKAGKEFTAVSSAGIIAMAISYYCRSKGIDISEEYIVGGIACLTASYAALRNWQKNHKKGKPK